MVRRIDAFHFCPHHPEAEVPEFNVGCATVVSRSRGCCWRRGGTGNRFAGVVDGRRPRHRPRGRSRGRLPHGTGTDRLRGSSERRRLDREALSWNWSPPTSRTLWRNSASPVRPRSQRTTDSRHSRAEPLHSLDTIGRPHRRRRDRRARDGDGPGRAGVGRRDRSRERTRRPPDRPQQRRHSLRALLQARLGEGASTAPPAAN